jgi:hypothetical protein
MAREPALCHNIARRASPLPSIYRCVADDEACPTRRTEAPQRAGNDRLGQLVTMSAKIPPERVDGRRLLASVLLRAVVGEFECVPGAETSVMVSITPGPVTNLVSHLRGLQIIPDTWATTSC